MANYKEIVTKAVIGKGKKTFSKNYQLTPELVPNTVLGCWVINHNFSGSFGADSIIINGNFDVNIWYSYENDTKTNVISKNIAYTEEVKVNTKENAVLDTLSNEKEIIIRSLKQPTCINVKLVDNDVDYTIEYELGIEVIGDTKVKIAVENDEEPWEIITDSNELEDVNNEIEQEVKEEFLELE